MHWTHHRQRSARSAACVSLIDTVDHDISVVSTVFRSVVTVSSAWQRQMTSVSQCDNDMDSLSSVQTSTLTYDSTPYHCVLQCGKRQVKMADGRHFGNRCAVTRRTKRDLTVNWLLSVTSVTWRHVNHTGRTRRLNSTRQTDWVTTESDWWICKKSLQRHWIPNR